MVAVEVLEVVRLRIFIKIRTMVVLMYGIMNERGPMTKEGHKLPDLLHFDLKYISMQISPSSLKVVSLL